MSRQCLSTLPCIVQTTFRKVVCPTGDGVPSISSFSCSRTVFSHGYVLWLILEAWKISSGGVLEDRYPQTHHLPFPIISTHRTGKRNPSLLYIALHSPGPSLLPTSSTSLPAPFFRRLQPSGNPFLFRRRTAHAPFTPNIPLSIHHLPPH